MVPRSPSNLIVAAVILVVGLSLCLLRARLPLTDYIYLFPDSFDWLANGLAYSGHLPAGTPVSHRGMFLTLLLAGLYRIHFEGLATIVGAVFHVLLSLALISVLSRIAHQRVALWTAFLFFTSYTTLGQSAFVGADVIANFFISLFALLLFEFVTNPRPRLMFGLSLLAGLGIHTQYVFPIFAPLFLMVVIVGLFTDKRRQILANLFSRNGLIAGMMFTGVVFTLFLPRIINYQLIYEEKVQHVSLLKFQLGGAPYFFSSYLVSFSWWIALLAGVGAAFQLRPGARFRMQAFYALSWIANAFVFFGLFYSWQDSRFWIYGSVPTFMLAAIGVEEMRSVIRSRIATVAISLVTIFFIQCTPTNDPWDSVMALTPVKAFVFDKKCTGEIHPYTSSPYLLRHVQEIREALTLSKTGGFSTIMRDSELNIALKNAALAVSHEPLIVFDSLSPSDYYIATNRNKVYAAGIVETVGDLAKLREALKSSKHIVCRAAECASVQSLTQGIAQVVKTAPLTTASAQYQLLTMTFDTNPQNSSVLSRLELLEGGTDLGKLFDGIVDVPDNFATIPLNIPLRMKFNSPINLLGIELDLWDFDAREYELLVTVTDESGARTALRDFQGKRKGSIISRLSSAPIRSLEVLGISNSSTEWIAGNDYLHIKEIRLMVEDN